MEPTPFAMSEVYMRYPHYFRQALRFILATGGEEALARFAHMMSESFERPGPTSSEDQEAARKWVTEMVASDLRQVWSKPDLILDSTSTPTPA